jgi:hypothetical protein
VARRDYQAKQAATSRLDAQRKSLGGVALPDLRRRSCLADTQFAVVDKETICMEDSGILHEAMQVDAKTCNKS